MSTGKIVIGGATGLIGRAIVKALIDKGYEVFVLTRNPGTARSLPIQAIPIRWTKSTGIKELKRYFKGAAAVINLAGAGVADKRWSDGYKLDIMASRLDATRFFVQSIEQSDDPPPLFISASAIGYYGNTTSAQGESGKKGEGLLADVSDVWEKEALIAESEKTKVAIVRIGVVLSNEGGALAKMITPYKFFVGGPLGNGEQYLSWIDRDDLVRLFLHIIETQSSGVYNGTAPAPVTMNEFSQTLARVLGRPNLFRVPEFALKLLLGERAEVVLSGQNALPERALSEGFVFNFTELEKSLQHQLNR